MELSVSELRANLREAVERANAGEDVTVTQHGKPVAMLVHPAHVRRLPDTPAMRMAAELRAEIDRLKALPEMSNEGTLPAEYAEELVAAIRTDRDAD